MAQIKSIDIPVQLLAHPGALDEEESSELAAYIHAAKSHSTTVDDMGGYTENALQLFFEQRRRTRTYVIGCSIAAAVLGAVMGYYAGKPAKGR